MLKYTLSCQKGEISSKTRQASDGTVGLSWREAGPAHAHFTLLPPFRFFLLLSGVSCLGLVFFLNVGVFGVTVKFMAGGSHCVYAWWIWVLHASLWSSPHDFLKARHSLQQRGNFPLQRPVAILSFWKPWLTWAFLLQTISVLMPHGHFCLSSFRCWTSLHKTVNSFSSISPSFSCCSLFLGLRYGIWIRICLWSFLLLNSGDFMV